MQKKWSNTSGKPLSSSEWLTEHHLAKLTERTAFIKQILLNIKPNIIVDLGCGTGLWLEILNDIADSNCEFIGYDTDTSAINEAKQRSKDWGRKITFIQGDFTDYSSLPKADLYLAFNIFSYIEFPDQFLENIRTKLNPKGQLVIRQYDGAALRFGPMKPELRINIENVLFSAVNYSQTFKHYDLDRVYSAIENSRFALKAIDFEIFKRVYPYPEEFLNYYSNTIKWTINYISEKMSKELQQWYEMHIENNNPSYFYEVDLIGTLTR